MAAELPVALVPEFGPKVSRDESCFSCPACVSESFHVQGDSGHDVYCAHPDFAVEQGGRKYVNTYTWRTPAWCPARLASLAGASQ